VSFSPDFGPCAVTFDAEMSLKPVVGISMYSLRQEICRQYQTILICCENGGSKEGYINFEEASVFTRRKDNDMSVV